MGNLQSFCCKDDPMEAEDERQERSCIWVENGANNHDYGACLPPPPMTIYKIVLPKLEPVVIEEITGSEFGNSHSISSSAPSISKSNSLRPFTGYDDVGSDTSNNLSETNGLNSSLSSKSGSKSQQSAVIKEEYCSEQFHTLRSYILKDDESHQRFRQLLWSCIPWVAPGGKSGSTFLKTVNDQFILKEMSKLELQSFLSIADDYFKYIQNSHHDNKPSLLSTILGIYRIVYTNSTTQSSSEYYFMVMRNLFYKRNISQRFDLKGSIRNRLVNTDDPDNTQHVLMDENLLQITCEHPLIIHEKSKQILNETIDSDSRFLTSISVMDYSLLVGVDKQNQELILGIIDYVRPFTWDKKIERVMKSVVGTELPTIIEPELYRERFCEAMDKYFESIPDD